MDEYQKWAEVCESLKDKEINFYFKEREVWWCNVGKNIGNEIDGKQERFERPVVVLNKISKDLFIALPLTTKFNFENYKIPVGLIGEQYGYALIEQFKVMSSKRLISYIGALDRKIFLNLKAIIKNLI